MFRRVFGVSGNRFSAAAAALSFQATRQAATSSAPSSNAPRGNDGKKGQGNNNQGNQGGNRDRNWSDRSQNLLPPAFDIIKTNDADMTKGYMLRAQYMNNCVVLNYMKQVMTTEQANANPTADRRTSARKFGGQQKVVVFLPTMFIARFLGVLEGNNTKCDIVARTTQGEFRVGTEPNTFVLACKSRVGDGLEEMAWECTLDAPGALMLQRFLVEALHYNSGF
jgi:hypothetical protein